MISFEDFKSVPRVSRSRMTPSAPPTPPPPRGADGQVSGLMTDGVMPPCVAANAGWEVRGIFLLCARGCSCVRDLPISVPLQLAQRGGGKQRCIFDLNEGAYLTCGFSIGMLDFELLIWVTQNLRCYAHIWISLYFPLDGGPFV